MELSTCVISLGVLCAIAVSGSDNFSATRNGSAPDTSFFGASPPVAMAERSGDDRMRRERGYDRERGSDGDLTRNEMRDEEMQNRADQGYEEEEMGSERTGSQEEGFYDGEGREREMGSRDESHDRFYNGEDGRFRPRSDDSDEGNEVR